MALYRRLGMPLPSEDEEVRVWVWQPCASHDWIPISGYVRPQCVCACARVLITAPGRGLDR